MDELKNEAKIAMSKTIESFRGSLATLRTGRANPSILNNILVNYYDTLTPLNQIAAISVPEPRQLLVKPFDKNDMRAILTAINAANLGFNPINEDNAIRLNFPPLTEERRREIVKQARKHTEEAKVAIRNIRRDFIDLARADEDISEDLVKRVEKEIQEVTDEMNKNIDDIMAQKETEIMTV
ncbi:MAG: ribosome recycling factor [Erysipelotrichia bacterium]|jgi:ribosome recycling factor|nr:ribosome recycling factor [Bacilli bacterium]NLB49309.1 ribosome recycling factor [Erysipelotrichia bacterium]